ncbi:MAG TPA: condensation domain-containing protein, partial [Candidatus Deferrimicrobium sp.]|nr:condensation domain-containing protein [Candidatus Deferrimicrobium sp.]
VDRETTAMATRLGALINREQVTVFFVTTALFNTLVDLEISCLRNTRKVLFGGEKISLVHSKKALAALGKGRIIHMYGPTETTVYATYYYIDHINGMEITIPIGKPIANTEIYILNKYLHPIPPGVFGEIYIGGDGVARGYLNKPELTAEKFNRSNLSNKTYIVYKTGDLARWLPDGNIEFSGRIDQQLKIRGFRVELGEIENELIKHKDVKDAVVVAEEDKTGDKYLCAYFVPHHTNIPKEEEFAAYLSEFLPGYMIPLRFIAIDKIPLNINGKVDRKALPRPGTLENRGNYTAPNNEMEEKLVELWSLVLGIEKDKISIDDHFFRLGGHSLKIVLLAARIHKEFNVMIAISKFFEISTVRTLAQYIRTAVSVKYSDIDPVEKKDYYPMAPAQKRMYILQEINPGTINYNMPLFTTLEGPLEKIKLENAFKELIYRHESLRTSFHMMASRAVQRIHDEVNFEVEYDETGDEEMIKNFIRPFDLSQAPFLRVRLLKKEKENHLLLVDMHHSISDGRSLDIFLAELFALYRGEKMPELGLQYKDFSEWLDKPAIL